MGGRRAGAGDPPKKRNKRGEKVSERHASILLNERFEEVRYSGDGRIRRKGGRQGERRSL